MIYGCLPSRYEYTNFVGFFFFFVFNLQFFLTKKPHHFQAKNISLNVIAMRDENSLSHSSHLNDSIEFAFLIIFGYSCRCYVLTFCFSSLYSYILSKIEKKNVVFCSGLFSLFEILFIYVFLLHFQFQYLFYLTNMYRCFISLLQ